jgi:hypothetical protein
MTSAPSSMLDFLSEAIVPEHVRPKLGSFFALSDELLFLDDTGELAADRRTLIRIASDDTLIPGSLRDIAVLETAKHLGRRVKERKRRSRRLTWQGAALYGLPVQPASETQLYEAGFVEATTIEQLDRILRARFSEIPRFWDETEPSQLRDTLMRNLEENQTFWDCLVRNLGFWAALVAIGSVIIWLALVAEIGWQAALVVAIIYSGFTTGYFILQCLADSSYVA